MALFMSGDNTTKLLPKVLRHSEPVQAYINSDICVIYILLKAITILKWKRNFNSQVLKVSNDLIFIAEHKNITLYLKTEFVVDIIEGLFSSSDVI